MEELKLGIWLGKIKDSFTSLASKLNKPIKIALVSTFGAGLAVTSVSPPVHADNSRSSSLKEVYHVYIDNDYIGTSENKDQIESFINEQKEQVQSDYKGVELVPNSSIDFLREFVFFPSDETNSIINHLDGNIEFQAKAIKLELEGELIGYVKNLDDANKALNLVAQKYLPSEIEEDFVFLEKERNEINLTDVIELMPDEMREVYTRGQDQEEEEVEEEESQQLVLSDGTVILDVGLSDNIKYTEEIIDPNQILSVEQLQKLLERGTTGKQVHTIQENEVLGQIAKNYDISLQHLFQLNPDLDEDSIIRAGQEIYVEGEKPYVDVTYTVEVTEEESVDYQVVTKQTDSLYKGQTRVDQSGQKGTEKVTYEVVRKNNEIVSKKEIDRERIKDPVDRVVLQGTKVISSRGTGNFAWPTHGGYISSHLGYRWGSYHKGIDIAGVSNRTIMAADNGVVTFAGWDGGYGNKVIINHNNGFRTVYAHLSSINVSVGQTVKKGQAIGSMGSTGDSTGVHLHFEMYRNGSLVNPLNYY